MTIFPDSEYLKEHQMPLALFYFKQTPAPSLDEITEFSNNLQAKRLAVYRWFNERRKELNLQDALSAYSFDYSKKDLWNLELYFSVNNSPSFENVIAVGKKKGIDEVKVDHWFKKKKVKNILKVVKSAKSLKNKNKALSNLDEGAGTSKHKTQYRNQPSSSTNVKPHSLMSNKLQNQQIEHNASFQAEPRNIQTNQMPGGSMFPIQPNISPNQTPSSLYLNQLQHLLNQPNPFNQMLLNPNNQLNHFIPLTKNPNPFYNGFGNAQHQQIPNMNNINHAINRPFALQNNIAPFLNKIEPFQNNFAPFQNNIAPFQNINQRYGKRNFLNQTGQPTNMPPSFNNLPATPGVPRPQNQNFGFTANFNQTNGVSDQPTQFIANNAKNQDELNRGIHEINKLLEKYRNKNDQ